jgi:hypothetical protein
MKRSLIKILVLFILVLAVICINFHFSSDAIIKGVERDVVLGKIAPIHSDVISSQMIAENKEGHFVSFCFMFFIGSFICLLSEMR